MRRTFSDLLMFSGLLMLTLTGSLWARATLADEQPIEPRYLLSAVRADAPLPILAETSDPAAEPLSTETQTPEKEPSGPTALGSEVIRLVVPRVAIDQTVVPVGLRPGSKSALEWDTDALFATESRRDLVGQLATSLNPGQGGNVILVGHNYDWGRYNWEGVFLHLGDIEPGNRISVYTRDGGAYQYTVERVVKVPSGEASKHDAYLWPSEREQLTLVTCGGPNFGHWSLRIYVIAIPIQ